MTEEVKKANHRAPVVLIAASMFRPHPDPDTTNLELIDVENYQVVVRKGQFGPGDPGEVKFFVFDIFTPENKWVDFNDFVNYGFRPADVRRVPFLYLGPFTKELLEEKAVGNSLVPGASHIREGVVTKPINERHAKGLGHVLLKLVSNDFLAKDSEVEIKCEIHATFWWISRLM